MFLMIVSVAQCYVMSFSRIICIAQVHNEKRCKKKRQDRNQHEVGVPENSTWVYLTTEKHL